MTMKLDFYTFQARIIPAVVTLLPAFVLSYRLFHLFGPTHISFL